MFLITPSNRLDPKLASKESVQFARSCYPPPRVEGYSRQIGTPGCGSLLITALDESRHIPLVAESKGMYRVQPRDRRAGADPSTPFRFQDKPSFTWFVIFPHQEKQRKGRNPR